ncbi:macrophage mannose receptor 1-like [Trachinotus anak]|uniref:macrophage mannose receptor 1-like n=1 Tax=Trachinotus anak TaxID=443729 RepID=UPI0039F21E99
MENLQSRSEHEEEMSVEQKLSQLFSTDGHRRSQRYALGQGLLTKGAGSAFPPHRLVLLGLGLLNAVLLIAGVVTGIYCAKAQDLQISYSAAAPLIAELNHLRNHSGIIKAKVEAQAALMRERASHLQLKLQVNQKKTISDGLQEQLETLYTEKTNIKSNLTALEESCGRCLQGWMFLKSSCYYFSYRSSKNKKNWPDSRADCISQGGDLLVINNFEEQQLMSDNFPKLMSSGSYFEQGFWIGLSENVAEEKWVWVDNTTVVETMYWRNGQPSRNEPQSRGCAAFNYYSDARRTWYNANCHDHELKWICEMEPNCLLCPTPPYTRGNVLTNSLSQGQSRPTALISTGKMEDKENLAGTFDSTYDKLDSQEDFNTDDQALYSNQDKQQVSMSVVRPESIMNHYRRLAVSLTVLAVILLVIDIGLGVYYSKLTGGHMTITDVNREITKLQAVYNAAIQSRDDTKKELAKEISEQQHTTWELEHQGRRNKDYEKQVDKMKTRISVLKTHLPMITEGCRHCLPGWTFMNSACYYFPFSDTISRRPWNEARQFCKNQGGDLAVIESVEKNMGVTNLINSYNDPTRPLSQSGFWIGLRDVEEEGIWKWLDGRRLYEGYWNDGEPNNQNNEDCAATYPRSNHFMAWNDAPCSYNLKWICEMAPRSGS